MKMYLTSVVGILLPLPFLAPRGICTRAPIGIHLHVQLSLPSRQLVILRLLFTPQGMPLGVG